MANKTVSVPKSVKQTGLIKDATDHYRQWYDGANHKHWSQGTKQRAIAKLWIDCGSKSDKGIATINGYYLVAVRPVFASAGDAITIFLEDGTRINCIVADEKGSDAGSKWGHIHGGKVSVVEWEATGSYKNIKLGKWQYKKVSKITNHGKYKKGSVFGTGDAAKVYLDECRKHLGSQGFVAKHVGFKRKTGWGWCAMCVKTIADLVEFSGVIMPGLKKGKVSSAPVTQSAGIHHAAYLFGKQIVTKYGGTYVKGPMQGNLTKPQPGDFIEIWNKNPVKGSIYYGNSKYASRHVGVVESVKNNGKLVTIEGGANWTRRTSRRWNVGVPKGKAHGIGWYARPDWSKVGGAGDGTDFGGTGMSGPLYTTSSTRADAYIRDVAFMTKDVEPTTSRTESDLSVINYTTVLAELAALVGGGGSEDSGDESAEQSKYDTSKLNNKNAEKIFNFFINKGLNKAQACGILGAIGVISNFDPGHVQETSILWSKVNSIGLCDWSSKSDFGFEYLNGRQKKMIKYVGKDWKTDLDGQLNFIWKELNGAGFKDKVLKEIKNKKKDSKDNAGKCAKVFFHKYMYKVGDDGAVKRARKYYDLIKERETTFKGGKFKWPVPSCKSISSKFGPRKAPVAGASTYHRGIDIPGKSGAKVIAGADGKVIESNYAGVRGNQILIDHGGKWYTRYQHLSSRLVKKGDKVTGGQQIGKVGSTGIGSGAHLHFEVLKGGITYGKHEVNPEKYL